MKKLIKKYKYQVINSIIITTGAILWLLYLPLFAVYFIIDKAKWLLEQPMDLLQNISIPMYRQKWDLNPHNIERYTRDGCSFYNINKIKLSGNNIEFYLPHCKWYWTFGDKQSAVDMFNKIRYTNKRYTDRQSKLKNKGYDSNTNSCEVTDDISN